MNFMFVSLSWLKIGGNANRQGQLSIPFRQFHIQSASIQLKRRCFYLFEITNYIIPDEK